MIILTSFTRHVSRFPNFFTLLGLLLLSVSAQAQVLTIVDPGFNTGSGGAISGQLTLISSSTNVGPQQIGTSGWYGISNATNLIALGVPVAGLRPGIAVNNDASSAGVGEINYALGLGLGGLLGLEMPEADLWQPLSGVTLQANKTYVFSLDFSTTSLLDITALAARGFGIGISTGASTTSIGTMYRDSLSNPSLISVSLLTGTAERAVLTFTTGASVPGGDLGVVIFAGRGNQGISASLLTDFKVDNASLAVVPEPRVAVLAGLGLIIVFHRGVFRMRRAQRGTSV